MATVTPTITGARPLANSADSALVTWTPLTNANNVGVEVAYEDYADRTVQMFGTFGGATVVLQGSCDGGTTWATLTDPQGNAISTSAALLEAVQEAVPLIRPSLSGGAGTSVTVILFVRGNHK